MVYVPNYRKKKFILVAQMKKAGLSISNNLAEGASRETKAEKNRFFEIARSSTVEIDSCLTVCLVLTYFRQDELKQENNILLQTFKLITGLIDSNNK